MNSKPLLYLWVKVNWRKGRMANTYKSIIDSDATTNDKVIYTCPAETVALVKSISAYNAHASASADWILKIYDSSSTNTYAYKKIASVATATKKEFLEGDESTILVLEASDAIKFNTSVTSATLFISVLQQDRT